MRYTVAFWKLPHAWWVKVRAYEELDQPDPEGGYSFQIDYSELKQDDLMHLLEQLHRQVGECTP